MLSKILKKCLWPSLALPLLAFAQESEISSTGQCAFEYSSPSFASLVRGEVQVASSVEIVDGEAWTIGSRDTQMELPPCDSTGGYCVKLTGTPLFIPADQGAMADSEWKHAGYRYVAGPPFVDLSRGRFMVIPIFVYADKSSLKSSLDFDAVFFVDKERNLKGYSFWKHDIKFGYQSVKVLSNYWLVGDRAPITCFKGGKRKGSN